MELKKFTIGQLIEIAHPNGSKTKGRITEIQEASKTVLFVPITDDQKELYASDLFTDVSDAKSKGILFMGMGGV